MIPMVEKEIKTILADLLTLQRETEWVEFKEAKNDFNFDDIGKYFSALSNEANLKDKRNAWLVFGINNKREIVGTNYRIHETHLHGLKHEISQHTNNNITFIEIYTIKLSEGRVILFQIPPAPIGIPNKLEKN